MTKLQNALEFLKSGISVIPLHHRSKEPMIKTWKPYEQQANTEYELIRWFSSNWLNYGVVCGWKNLMVIDFDDTTAFEIWFDYFLLLNKHETIYPMPYIVRTSRGAHVYLSMPGGERANEKRRGVDLKFHGYVVGPGSVHPNGTQYAAVGEFRLVEVYSLDTILPLELFPRVAPACGQTELFQEPAKIAQQHTEYEPYQSAMFSDASDLISKVKSRVRIENFFSTTYKTSSDGRWLSTLCLFHDDKHPSMWLDTKLQICGCNTCGFKPLDVINLYSRIHNLSNSDAITALAKECGVWA